MYNRLGVLRLTNTLYVPLKWAYPLVDAGRGANLNPVQLATKHPIFLLVNTLSISI